MNYEEPITAKLFREKPVQGVNRTGGANKEYRGGPGGPGNGFGGPRASLNSDRNSGRPLLPLFRPPPPGPPKPLPGPSGPR